MPALFSCDWQFHQAATQRRDDGGRHESGKRTKDFFFSVLRLSLSPFFTLTSLFMFPRAGFCFAIISAPVFIYLFVFTFACRVHRSVQLKSWPMTPHSPKSFFILHLPTVKWEVSEEKPQRSVHLHTQCSCPSMFAVAAARLCDARGLSHGSSQWATHCRWLAPNTPAYTLNISRKSWASSADIRQSVLCFMSSASQ